MNIWIRTAREGVLELVSIALEMKRWEPFKIFVVTFLGSLENRVKNCSSVVLTLVSTLELMIEFEILWPQQRGSRRSREIKVVVDRRDDLISTQGVTPWVGSELRDPELRVDYV